MNSGMTESELHEKLQNAVQVAHNDSNSAEIVQATRALESANAATTERGFPLALLFVLTAFFGAIIAMLGPIAEPIRSGELQATNLAIGVGVATGVTLCLAFVVSFFFARFGQTILLSFLSAIVVGPIVGMLVFIPADKLTQVLTGSIAASCFLIGAALWIRQRST